MATRVHLCGRLEVEWEGERLEAALPGRQARLLFAYLTLHRDRPVRRDELIEALWADAVPADGDALLRPVLSRLRRALGTDRLEGRAELALRYPPGTWVDVEAVRDGLTRARERQAMGDHAAAWEAATDAVRIAERGVLPGLEAGWIDEVRAELEAVHGELLEAVALAGARLGPVELAQAEKAARRAVALAPYRESARVALIDVLRRRGNFAEALVASIGVLQLLQGRAEAAAASFERALELSRTMEARPYVARSQAGLAQALRRLGEEARAAELATEASATARELGMLRLQRELEAGGPLAAPTRPRGR